MATITVLDRSVKIGFRVGDGAVQQIDEAAVLSGAREMGALISATDWPRMIVEVFRFGREVIFFEGRISKEKNALATVYWQASEFSAAADADKRAAIFLHACSKNMWSFVHFRAADAGAEARGEVEALNHQIEAARILGSDRQWIAFLEAVRDQAARTAWRQSEPQERQASISFPRLSTGADGDASPATVPSSPAIDKTDRTVTLLFATTRARSNREEEYFSGERGSTMSYGSAVVRVPDERRIGTLKLPFQITIPLGRFSITLKQPANPKKHFILVGIEQLDKSNWHSRIASSTLKEALVFVHGFNVGFLGGVYRFAQIAWDLKYEGIPILFSWPSRGRTLAYGYDRNSALGAKRAFLDLLVSLRAQGIETLHVLAHSMGNFLVLEALSAQEAIPEGLGELLMAAPDIDRDHYLQIAPHVRKAVRGMTLYASAADKAMQASRRLAGDIPRAGDVPAEGPCLVDDVDAIDATALGSEILGLNHGNYAEKTSILNDVRQLVTTGLRPPRKRLVEIEDMPAGAMPPKWWRFAS